MNSLDNYRVLCRRGARELTTTETEFVNGAQFHTNVCTAITAATSTTTGPGDGDGCSDTDMDHG